MLVKIWCPDAGNIDDAHEAEIRDISQVERAVMAYARSDWHESDYWESCVFHADVGGGKVLRFEVRAEQTVEFSSKELR